MESNSIGLDTDAILNMKLDGIKEQLATIQCQHPTRPLEDTKTPPERGEAHIVLQPSKTMEKADESSQESSKEHKSEDEDFQEVLKECVQSAHEFVSSTRTVIGSRASAAGSTTGFGLASEAGQNFATERRLDIEKWIPTRLHTDTNSTDREGLGSHEPSGLSRAERRFVEVCEEVEQLGRNGNNDEAADIGMDYLQELWDHYGSRLREHYTSGSYQATYMTEEMHGQQLRKDILESQGRGFIGPERSSKGTYSILHFLAHIGCSAELRLFLIRTNVDPNVRDHARKTPLIRAAHMGHRPIVASLLDLTDIAVNTADSRGCTALDYATLNNDTDIVELFLRHLEREPVRDDRYISRPFQLAARNGRLSVMKLLVTRPELDINHKGEDQETALHSAIIKDEFAVVQFLLKQPVIDIEKTAWDEHTPLLLAARYASYSILHALLDRQDINVNSCTSQGSTPLLFIAARGSKEIAGRLLRKGGDPDIPDRLGNIPIVLAASRCYLVPGGAPKYRQEKREPEKHFELIEEFLKFYGIKKQTSQIMHRYVDLCTQRMEQTSAGKTPLANLDLSSRWFEIASSNHKNKEDAQLPLRITPLVSETEMDPSLAQSVQTMTFGGSHKDTSINYHGPTMSSVDQDISNSPKYWRSLLGRKSDLSVNDLYLSLIKSALDDHCSDMQRNGIVTASQITAVYSEYETRIGSYLQFNPSRLVDPSKFIMAMAMLWQRPNATFVLGPSHSGKSKFIWLTCGNVQKRIKATVNGDGIASSASDPQFIVTGAWLNGGYCPVIEVRCKSIQFLTAQALNLFARSFGIDVTRIVCTIPYPPKESWKEYTGGFEGVSDFQVIRGLQFLNSKKIPVTYVTVGGPDWIDTKSFSLKRLGIILDSYEKTMQLHDDDMSEDLEKLEISLVSTSADAVEISNRSLETFSPSV